MTNLRDVDNIEVFYAPAGRTDVPSSIKQSKQGSIVAEEQVVTGSYDCNGECVDVLVCLTSLSVMMFIDNSVKLYTFASM